MVADRSNRHDGKSAGNTCCCASRSVSVPDNLSAQPFTDTGGPGRRCGWVDGGVASGSRIIPRVRTKLDLRDIAGSWKVRWGIGRRTYRIPPGLYAVGSPTPESPVLVTANYKMSFDRLRAGLGGRNVWILVLDTRGINVWCAAGKGTFGTEELLRRVERERLAGVVKHRTLILPQLSATGVSAHEVKARSGWRIKYGPIRSEDLNAYFDSGMKATPEMRRVTFGMFQRLVLVPVEVVMSAKYLLIVAACFLFLSGLGTHGYSLASVGSAGLRSLLLLVLAYAAGAVLTPVILPWLPGPAFSLKGASTGVLTMLAVLVVRFSGVRMFDNRLEEISWIFLVPAIASFLAMNFTGATTFTSPSGVRREMRFAVPMQIVAAAAGSILWLASRFV